LRRFSIESTRLLICCFYCHRILLRHYRVSIKKGKFTMKSQYLYITYFPGNVPTYSLAHPNNHHAQWCSSISQKRSKSKKKTRPKDCSVRGTSGGTMKSVKQIRSEYFVREDSPLLIYLKHPNISGR
jgi:hypothetical protein